MLIGAMIDHKIHDDRDVFLFGFCDQTIHILQRTKTRVDILIIGNIIAIIHHRGRIDRRKP